MIGAADRFNHTVRYDWLKQYLFESNENSGAYAMLWLWA
jgi:hypothetical protein